MTDLPTFIASAQEAHTLKATPDTYQVLVLLRRDVGDELAMFEHDSAEVTGELMAGQIVKELQVAYDEGMAGHFQILKVSADLTPHVLNVITPQTPLSPWQVDFANAYGEDDYAWMRTLADTTDAGDTLFTAVMVELDAKEDCTDAQEAVDRLNRLIAELEKARDAIQT